MAGTHIAINSTYDPLSMEEMLKMPMLATEAQLQTEEAYSKLAQDAADLESLANSAKDQATYVKYKTYANEVQKQLNELSGRGLNPNSRRSLYDLSARYKSEIDPIKQTMKTREDLIAEQRKARSTNNKILYDIDYANMSLDDMMKQSTHSYNSLDGTQLYEEGKNQAAAMSSRMLSESQRQALQGQYFELTQTQGLDHTAAMNFLIDNNSVPELAALKNSLMSQYDLSGYGEEAKKQAENFLAQGIFEGITYKDSKQYLQNGDYMSRADQTRFAIDQQSLKIREIEAKMAQDKYDYWLKYGKDPDEGAAKEANEKSKGAAYRDAATTIRNFGNSQTPYLMGYNADSNIPGYNFEDFEPGKEKDFDGEDSGFNESVAGDDLTWEYFNQEWMASPKTIAKNLQKGSVVPRNLDDLTDEAQKEVLEKILPEVKHDQVLDKELRQEIAENVIILEDRTNTAVSGGGKTPQYLVVPRRWAEENLSTPEEQAPAATTAAKPAATSAAKPKVNTPAAKNWGPRRPGATPSTLDEAAEMQ